MLRALILGVLVLTGCGGGEDADAPMLRAGHVALRSQRGVEITVSAREPVKTGPNVLDVTVAGDPGPALLSATALMPSHGHGSRPPIVEPSDTGWVVEDLVLYMAGRWEVRLVLAGDDEAMFLVDVP